MTNGQYGIVLGIVLFLAVLLSPLIIMRLASLISYGWAKGKRKFEESINTQEGDDRDGRKK